MKLLLGVRFGLFFCVILTLLLLTGCQEDDIWTSTYAKVYFFWHRPSFDSSGYEFFQLSNYTSSHFDKRLIYKITQIEEDNSLKVMAPHPIKINNETTYFNQCGTYNILINARGETIKIPKFVYRGEKNIMVARGNGWSMFISREVWK